jgi:hypothetical protein
MTSILKHLPDGIMLANHWRPMYLNKKAIEFMQLEDTGITSDSFIEAIKLGGSEAAQENKRVAYQAINEKVFEIF